MPEYISKQEPISDGIQAELWKQSMTESLSKSEHRILSKGNTKRALALQESF